MRRHIALVAAGAAALALAAGCGATTVTRPASSSTSEPTTGYPGMNGTPPATSAPAAQTRQYTSCLTILQKLHATGWTGNGPWADSGPNGGPADASEADGNMPDGTQVQCQLGPPMIPGYYPPQTAYGNGWEVDVFGATTTAQVAAILGGQVGTSGAS
jgi:hypothetical protein